MSCWEEQAEVSDSSCKSSQLSMAHSSFQRGISAAFCTCLTIKIKSCGLWVEAVLKYLYPALSWLYHHPCFLPGWIKSGRKRVFFSCLGLSGTGGLGPSRGSQWPPSFAKCSWPCPWILQPGWDSDAVQCVSDFCHNVWQLFRVCLPAHMQSSLLLESLGVFSI